MKSGSYSPVTGKVKDVFQFLLWKSSIIPEHFTNEDLKIINNHDLGKLTSLSIKGYSYSKSVMKHYSEQLWQSSINSQYQLEGYTEAPTVSATKLKFPPKSSRQLETLFLSLFYPNNIMNVGEGRKIHFTFNSGSKSKYKLSKTHCSNHLIILNAIFNKHCTLFGMKCNISTR